MIPLLAHPIPKRIQVLELVIFSKINNRSLILHVYDYYILLFFR